MTHRIRFLCLIFLICIAGTTVQVAAQSPGKSAPSAEATESSQMLAQLAATTRMRMADVKKRIAETEAKMKLQVDRVQKKSVSDIAFEDVFRMLHLQNAELSIDMQGLGARLELLRSKATAKEKSGKVDDGQRQLLRKYVANQAKRLETLQKLEAQGAVPSQEVAEAESLLMEAKIKLEQFEAESREVSPAMVNAIFETSLEIAEKKARLEAVREMLAKHTDARAAVYEISELRQQVASEKLTLRNLSLQLQKIRQSIEDEKNGSF